VSTAVQNTIVVSVSVDGQQPAPAIVTGNTWSFTVTSLATAPVGTKTITVLATDVTDTQETATQQILLLPAATITGAPRVATNQTGATLTIGGNGVEVYDFTVDNVPVNANVPVGTPIVLSGLSDAIHTVSVLGKNTTLGLQQPAATPTIASWRVKSIPPVLTLDPVASVSGPSLTIGGTVELGVVPVVLSDTVPTVFPVSVIGGSGIATWSCTLTGLTKGTNNITITAIDIASNVVNRTAGVKIIFPDGDFKERGTPDIGDALKALYIAVGNIQATDADRLHGDVAPLVNSVPAPDGAITVEDALIILRKVVGLVSF
jgi:hypothetical protein